MRLALIVSIGLLTAGGAAARAADCDNARSQNELSACAAKAMDKADRTLNEAYEKVIVRLKADPKAAELLRKSQHAWIAFRDSDCAFMSSGVEGGSCPADDPGELSCRHEQEPDG